MQPASYGRSSKRLVSDLELGLIGGVVVYDLDRFARQPRDLERAIDLYDRNPALVFATVQGDVALQSSDGRTLARVMVAFANKASMDTSRRVTRKHLEMAQQGRPHGGPRAFGWKDDKRTINPPEAALIRQAAADVLEGRSLHKIVLDWNARGSRTPRGNRWQRGPVRALLRSPRLAGLVVYRGAVVDGVVGNWSPFSIAKRGKPSRRLSYLGSELVAMLGSTCSRVCSGAADVAGRCGGTPSDE